MEIIVFLLKNKFKGFFRSNNTESLIGNALYALVLLLYAGAAGYLFSHGAHDKAPLIMQAICYSLLFVPLFYKVFPSFSLKKLIIAPQYPISRVQKATIDLFAFALFKTIYLILLLFVLVFYFSAGPLPLTGLITLLLYWITGILFAENLLNAISWRKKGYIALLALLCVLYYLALKFAGNLHLPQSALLLGISVVLVFAFYIFYQDQETSFSRSAKRPSDSFIPKKGYWRIVCSILIGNNNAATSMLMGVLCINTLMAIIFLSGQKTGATGLDALFAKIPFMAFCFLPLVLFTYVFENLWGFYYQLAVNNLIIQPNFKKQLKVYLSLYLPAVLVMLITTSVITVCYHCFSWKILLAYVAFSGLGIPIGFLSSNLRYKRMEKNFDFLRIRTATSLIATISMLVLAAVIGYFYPSKYFLYAMGAILLAGAMLLGIIYKYDQHLTSKLKWRILERHQ